MVEDKQEDKFDFTAEGEALGYISLDQAIVQARQLARQQDEHIRQRLGWEEIVWAILNSEQRDDSHRVLLQFRRPVRGVQEGQTGEEEFLFSLTGELIDRQVTVWPAGTQSVTPETKQSPPDYPRVSPQQSQRRPSRGQRSAESSSSRTNPFAVQGASSPTWTFISQGYTPHPNPYNGELLQDKYALSNWVELESSSGKRAVVGRNTAAKHYGVKLPRYSPKSPETPNWPSK